MGTNVTLGVAAGATAADEAEVAIGLELGWAVAGCALADGVALDAPALDGTAVADDALALQADSASPTPRPSTQMLAILVVRMKCRELVIISLIAFVPSRSGGRRGQL
jgi:hypothetical protein